MTEFTIADLQTIFRRLSDNKWNCILIGGQAVNLYANHYADRIPRIATFQPLASRDLDFHGGPRDAKRAIKILNAVGKINDGSDYSPNAGVLQVALDAGGILVIDILTTVFGISSSELSRSSVTWTLFDNVQLQVLHPLLLMESKLACLRSLKQMARQDEKHVRIMTSVLLVWLEEQLQTPRTVYRAIERIAALMMTPDGVSAFERGVDLWQAIPLDAMKRTNEYNLFFDRRLPQLIDQVDEKRKPADVD